MTVCPITFAACVRACVRAPIASLSEFHLGRKVVKWWCLLCLNFFSVQRNKHLSPSGCAGGVCCV